MSVKTSPAEREVLDLHAALQDWLSGSVERNSANFDRIRRQLALSFGYFLPDGRTLWRDTLLAQLEACWGCKGPDFRLRIENLRVVVQTAVLAVVVYEEWEHFAGGESRCLLSTAVLGMHNGNRNNIEWLHVHESVSVGATSEARQVAALS